MSSIARSKLWMLLCCCLLAVTQSILAEEKPLVVGMELSYPPFEMQDAQGEPAGVSVELAKALADSLGRPLKIENIPFDGLIPSLKTGKIDLIISSMTATDARRKSIDFSDPYCRTGLCLLVGKDSPIQGIGDLNKAGKKVAVKQGTTGQLYAAKNLTSAEVLVFDREDAAVLEVEQGKVDAFIYDQMSTYQNWQKHQAGTRALLQPFQEEAWAIGIRKGNDALTKQVNEFLAKYKAEGGFEKLGDRFLKEQKTAFQQLGFPFFF